MEAARCQPSAFSDQLLNKFCDFSRFTEQDFFAKRKEVTHKESIRAYSSNEELMFLPEWTDLV